MLKRKFKEFHEDEVGTNSLSNNGLRAQQEKLKNILEQSKTALTRALRIAKRIERQKLGRRQKTAKESNAVPEDSRLNTEVASLKALDLSAKAEIYLYKSMLKTKPIVSAAAFPSYVLAKVETASQPQDIAHANVQARLFNSSVVKVAMTNIMDSIRVALGIGNEEKARKKKRMRAADYAPENKPIKQAPLKQFSPGEILATKKEDKYDRQTQSPMESLHVESDVTYSENERVNLAAYGDRLAESEDESAQELYSQEPSTEHKKLEYCTFRDPSPSPSRSTSSSSSVLDSPKPRKISTTTPRSTIFLPSLTMGGYISDSGSDSAVSDPFSLSGNATPKRRKNRRGQQERRQIWEKKYGGNANHFKGQDQQQQRKHDQGWDSQKGATGVGGNDRGKRGKGRGRGRVVDASSGSSNRTARARAAGKGRVGPIRSGANGDPVQARRGGNQGHDASAKGNQTPAAAANTPLHPSWEAAKRKKEANKNVAFQGKKVVFS